MTDHTKVQAAEMDVAQALESLYSALQVAGCPPSEIDKHMAAVRHFKNVLAAQELLDFGTAEVYVQVPLTVTLKRTGYGEWVVDEVNEAGQIDECRIFLPYLDDHEQTDYEEHYFPFLPDEIAPVREIALTVVIEPDKTDDIWVTPT